MGQFGNDYAILILTIWTNNGRNRYSYHFVFFPSSQSMVLRHIDMCHRMARIPTAGTSMASSFQYASLPARLTGIRQDLSSPFGLINGVLATRAGLNPLTLLHHSDGFTHLVELYVYRNVVSSVRNIAISGSYLRTMKSFFSEPAFSWVTTLVEMAFSRASSTFRCNKRRSWRPNLRPVRRAYSVRTRRRGFGYSRRARW